MAGINKLKVVLLFVGDVIALYAGLFVTLVIRYGGGFYSQFVNAHAAPFTFIFALWLIVFYIAGLYDLRRHHNNLDFLKTFLVALVANGIIAALIFYLIPAFGIAPKTNLLITLVVFAAIEAIWRRAFNRALSLREAPNKIIIIGGGKSAQEVVALLKSNPQLGYSVVTWLKDDVASSPVLDIKTLTTTHGANGIVVPRHMKQNFGVASALYELLNAGVEIHDLTNFYELVMGKVPLDDLEEAWFLENLLVRNPLYEFLKRIVDIIFSIILGIVAIPLSLCIAIAVRLSSPGPIVLRQKRVGENGKPYTHYKFRTMRESTDGKNYWLDEDHARITPVGNFLRKTHLDELPQVVNLLRGELSLVGPRPDFYEFWETLKGEVPYYTIRTITKPGLSGWAQVNFPVTASIDETKERLGYDIYYLKNRSIALDLLIILRTIKTVLTASGK